jgi:hypothetical protein
VCEQIAKRVNSPRNTIMDVDNSKVGGEWHALLGETTSGLHRLGPTWVGPYLNMGVLIRLPSQNWLLAFWITKVCKNRWRGEEGPRVSLNQV